MIQERDLLRDERKNLEQDIELLEKKKNLSRLENQMLHDFIVMGDSHDIIDLVLSKIIPDTSRQFGFFLRCDGGRLVTEYSRGISKESLQGIALDSTLCDRVFENQILRIDETQILKNGISQQLKQKDRKKIKSLFLTGIQSKSDRLGILVTTNLAIPGIEESLQLEIVKKLIPNIAKLYASSRTRKKDTNQLQITKEILELRAIIDNRFDSPMEMIANFLECLRNKISADRTALYLAKNEIDPQDAALFREGQTMQPGVSEMWCSHEDQIAWAMRDELELAFLDTDQLKRIGVESLIEEAFVVPLIDEQRKSLICTLLVTKKSVFQNIEQMKELLKWVSQFFAETIVRALSHAAVARQARIDQLTQLSNRREFDDRIVADVQRARSSQTNTSLMLIDIDHFKLVNDNYGHPAGDEVLRSISRILKEQVGRTRAEDKAVIARFGGEELAIILPEFGVPGTVRVAESIREAVERHVFQYQDSPIRITVSIGIAVFPNHAQTVDEFVVAADQALYEAKNTGRNRVIIVKDVGAILNDK